MFLSMRFLLLAISLGFTVSLLAAEPGPIVYPFPRKCDHTDIYFGKKVADPYRWMEEENTPDLNQWIEKENKVTRSVLDSIDFRDQLEKDITGRFNYPKYSLPFKKGNRYFFLKNNGLQNQSVLYVTESLTGEPRVLLDPNKLSTDGTVSLANLAVSHDGKYLAWSISKSGSDWNEAFVTEISTGKQLSDHIKWLKFSDLAWSGDGFYYSCFAAPAPGNELSAKNEFHKVRYHRINTDPANDPLVFVNKDHPQRTCFAQTDDDEQWLFVYESESTYGNRILFKKLSQSDSNMTVMYPDFKAESSVIDVADGKFFVLTDYKAPNRRLVVVDPANPMPEHWKDIIPESKTLLESVVPTGNGLAAVYLKDAANECLFFDRTGKETGRLPVDELGVFSLSGKRGDNELFYSFTSFLRASTIYRFDEATEKSSVLFDSSVDFKPELYTTKRVWYTSRDGTRAPLFLTYRKDMKHNGSNPTLLYGYGGFNISMKPTFSPARTVYLDHGGILAIAVLRGGGEYGEKWHKAGTKLQKQNVFDDFIAAAEFLIKEKYTSPEHLAINGGSNGGLLVGAAMTQRPDLFKAAVPQVGVLDMLRYHKFTIGWAWAVDYGTSEESQEMFNALFAYSPLHQIKKGVKYPATLIMTSDHDDRVVPAHSFKFAATLQEANAGSNPVLIRIETKAGHGHGKPLSKIIAEAADMYAFILSQTK